MRTWDSAQTDTCHCFHMLSVDASRDWWHNERAYTALNMHNSCICRRKSTDTYPRCTFLDKHAGLSIAMYTNIHTYWSTRTHTQIRGFIRKVHSRLILKCVRAWIWPHIRDTLHVCMNTATYSWYTACVHGYGHIFVIHCMCAWIRPHIRDTLHVCMNTATYWWYTPSSHTRAEFKVMTSPDADLLGF